MPNKAKPSETSTEILLLGFLCVKGVETVREKVGILDRFGLATSDIATICDCSEQTIMNVRHEMKKPAVKKAAK